MAIVLQDQSGLGQGIQQASGALGQALQQRGLYQQQKQQMSALDQALSQADFSTPEGKKTALRAMIEKKVPIKDALAMMKQFAPDPVDAFLNKYSGGPGEQPEVSPGGGQFLDQTMGQMPVPGQQVGVLDEVQEQTYPIPGRPGEQLNLIEQQTNLFSQLPDAALIEAAASGDPRLKSMSEAEQDNRTRSDKRYESDRKFHSEGARPWLKKIDESRAAVRSKNAALDMMGSAIQEGNLEFFSPDNFANFLGRFGEGLRSPEGVLMLNATKEFLLSNIQRAGSRPNQWIEQQISQMLTQIGRSEEANLSTVEALRSEAELEKMYIDQTDQISDFYREKLGFVPENIGALVDKGIEPLAIEIQDKLAYNLRNIKEQHGDIDTLSKKKVVRGTPLTFEMMNHLADVYGPGKALERAKKLGYTIPTQEQYGRYQ